MSDPTALCWPELAAVVLSRELHNGEVGSPGGSRSEIPLAAARLAQLLHAPDLCIVASASGCILSTAGKPWSPMFASMTDYRIMHCGTEAVMPFSTLFWSRRDWFFAGGIEVDRFGNLNLSRVADDERVRLQGPGPAALPSATTHARRFYITMQEHSPRTFVERLSYRTAMGHGDGPGDRRRLGLPGGGPVLAVSPLAVMDFEPDSLRMRLKSVHAGVTLAQVVAATGFELVLPAEVPTTQAPTALELETLRMRIDREGVLRTP